MTIPTTGPRRRYGGNPSDGGTPEPATGPSTPSGVSSAPGRFHDQPPLIPHPLTGELAVALIEAAERGWRDSVDLDDPDGLIIPHTIAAEVAKTLIPRLRAMWHVDDPEHMVYLGQQVSLDDFAHQLHEQLAARLPGSFMLVQRTTPIDIFDGGAEWYLHGAKIIAWTRDGEPVVTWYVDGHEVTWPARAAFEIFLAGLTASVHTSPDSSEPAGQEVDSDGA